MKRIIILMLLFILVSVSGCGTPSITTFATPDGKTLGPIDAKVKVYEYTDYQCPYCKKAEDIVYDLVKLYGNKIRFEHKDFVVHPGALYAAEAANCAADQNKFWDYNKILFENQDKLNLIDLTNYAGDAGLDLPKFTSCLLKHEKKSVIEAGMQEGTKAGVQGTPTFIVNGQVIPGLADIAVFEGIINKELAK